jgi:hypothetical protein
MNAWKFLAATILLVTHTAASSAAFLTPNSSAPVFEDWTRGAANSVYAEWDVFTQANGGTNSPDVGQSGVLGATVVQDNAATFALITSGGNIYSFAGPTSFDVTVPGYGLGAGSNTRIVAQIATQGNPLLPSSLQMTYSNGGSITSPPTALYDRGAITDGAITRNEWLAVWDIPAFNPSSSKIEFAASTSSMSLDKVAVDTYVKVGSFAALPTAIPEPTTLVLVGLTAMTSNLVFGRRPRREAVELSRI